MRSYNKNARVHLQISKLIRITGLLKYFYGPRNIVLLRAYTIKAQSITTIISAFVPGAYKDNSMFARGL